MEDTYFFLLISGLYVSVHYYFIFYFPTHVGPPEGSTSRMKNNPQVIVPLY